MSNYTPHIRCGAGGFGFPVRAVAERGVGLPAGGGEGFCGVFAFWVGGVVDPDLRGPVTAVLGGRSNWSEGVDVRAGAGELAFALLDLAVAAAGGFAVGPFEGVEAFDVVVELHLPDVAGVTGGDRFGFGGRVADVPSPDVVDSVGVDFFAFDLFDKAGFGFVVLLM